MSLHRNVGQNPNLMTANELFENMVKFKDSKTVTNKNFWLTPWRRALLEKLTVTQLHISCLLWNPKFHYCVHKVTLLVSTLSQMDLVKNFPSHFSTNRSNIIPCLRLGLSDVLFPSQLRDQNFIRISHFSLACYMPPSDPPWFDHRSRIWWSLQVMQLLITQSSPASRRFLRPNILFSALFPNIPDLFYSLTVREKVSLTYLLTYLLTHYVTQRSRVLLEKLIVIQLVKKFPIFCGNRSFITNHTKQQVKLMFRVSIYSLVYWADGRPKGTEQNKMSAIYTKKAW
jgi:hypothetical protein